MREHSTSAQKQGEGEKGDEGRSGGARLWRQDDDSPAPSYGMMRMGMLCFYAGTLNECPKTGEDYEQTCKTVICNPEERRIEWEQNER